MRLTGLGLGTASIITIPTDTPLGLFAATIQQVEGYYPGSLAYRNNNPGNLRLDSGGYYARAFGAVPGAGGYAAFPDLATGTAALEHQIQVDAGAGLTIAQMMAKYAPSSDGNNPSAYAQTIANALGVTTGTLVSDAISGGGVGPSSTGTVTGDAVDAVDATDPASVDSTATDAALGLDSTSPATLAILAVAALLLLTLARD